MAYINLRLSLINHHISMIKLGNKDCKSLR